MYKIIMFLVIMSNPTFYSNFSLKAQCSYVLDDALQYEVNLEMHFRLIFGEQCNNVFKCYGDSTLKLNSGVLLNDSICEIFEELKISQIFDELYIKSIDGSIQLIPNSCFYSVVESLSIKSPKIQEYYLLLKEINEISPTMTVLFSQYLRDLNNVSTEDKFFILVHLATVYFTLTTE